jgi:hypothetical protein
MLSGPVPFTGAVDGEALITALREGKISGAGLDTLQKEAPEDIRRLAEAGPGSSGQPGDTSTD